MRTLDQSDLIELSGDDLRQVALYAARCARRCLPIFEAECPNDTRPREAIEGAETFAAARLRAQGWAARKAAGETEHSAAASAARAASFAAGAAYLHPRATPHQVRHILGAAMYQALAVELAAGGDQSVADSEVQQSIDHAPLAVRDLLRRMPPAPTSGSHMGVILSELDTALRRR